MNCPAREFNVHGQSTGRTGFGSCPSKGTTPKGAKSSCGLANAALSRAVSVRLVIDLNQANAKGVCWKAIAITLSADADPEAAGVDLPNN